MAILNFYGAQVEYDDSKEHGIFVLGDDQNTSYDQDPAPQYMRVNVKRFLTTPWPPTASVDVNKQIEEIRQTKADNLTGIEASKEYGILGNKLEQITTENIPKKLEAVENTNQLIGKILQAITPFLN